MDNRKLITLAAAALLCCASAAQTVVTAPEAPFEFEALVMYDFPDREFPITRYGARRDDPEATTEAFAKAMKACSKAGGGKVVVPEGEWLSGPVHFSSNCLLWLDEGSKLVFEDDPELYLPAVRTSWEGTECMNYSPLIYAYECENVGIAGPGTIAPKMDFWRTWFDRPDAHIQATRQLYAMCSTGVPMEHRRMEEGEANMRPHLIQFNRCTNVRLNDFKIRESPFWTIHLYMCSDVWANGLDVYAHGHNNDGIDIEMTRHAVIENCRFDQGDDAVVLKAGRNQDAWRLAQPRQRDVRRSAARVHARLPHHRLRLPPVLHQDQPQARRLHRGHLRGERVSRQHAESAGNRHRRDVPVEGHRAHVRDRDHQNTQHRHQERELRARRRGI